MRVRKSAFLAKVRSVLGDVPLYVIAQHLNMHPTTLTLNLSGRRPPTNEFIADTLDELGGDFDELFYIEGATNRSVPRAVAA